MLKRLDSPFCLPFTGRRRGIRMAAATRRILEVGEHTRTSSKPNRNRHRNGNSARNDPRGTPAIPKEANFRVAAATGNGLLRKTRALTPRWRSRGHRRRICDSPFLHRLAPRGGRAFPALRSARPLASLRRPRAANHNSFRWWPKGSPTRRSPIVCAFPSKPSRIRITCIEETEGPRMNGAWTFRPFGPTRQREKGTAWKRCRMLALLTDLLLACMMLAPGYAGKLSAPCGVEA